MKREPHASSAGPMLAKPQNSANRLRRRNRRLKRSCETQADRFAHEFRGPLTVIKEHVSLLQDGLCGELSSEQRETLEVIHDRTDDLNSMVDDMLHLTRLMAGTLSANRVTCWLADSLEEWVPAMERKVNLRGANFSAEFDADLEPAFCDAEMIGHVVINLVLYLLKFGGEPASIVVRARNDRRERQVLLEVAGLSPRARPEVQQAIYAQVERTFTSSRNDPCQTRLGLIAARELVHLNLGTLAAEAAIGQGVSFSFGLPVAAPDEVLRRHLKQLRRQSKLPSALSVVRIWIEDAGDSAACDDVDCLLNWTVRRNELLFRTSESQWLLIVPRQRTALLRVFARFKSAHEEANKRRLREELPPLHLATDRTWIWNSQSEEMDESLRTLFAPLETVHGNQHAECGS